MKNRNGKYGWIVIWAIGSIVFAFVIHWLFSIEPTVEFFRAKWSAGDILTYASTIILGLLALWQNQRFKEENDKSQERLEKISNRTNELQIISQLIEHENERINLLRKLFQEFFEVCSCSNIVAEYRDTSKNKANAEYREMVEEEFTSLTKLGNDFRIRHHETNKKDICCKEHYDYLFHRCIAVLRLVTSVLRENSLNENG